VLPALLAGRLFLPGLIVPPVHLFVAAVVLLVVCGLWLAPARRDWRRLARRAASFALVVIVMVGYPAAAAAFGIKPWSETDAYFSVAYLVLAVVIPIAALRAWRDQEEMLLTICGVLVLFSAIAILSGQWLAYLRGVRHDWSAARRELTEPVPLGPPHEMDPDIVHIVLDGMGREDVLEHEYAIDARRFRRLEEAGLELTPDAVANYAHTYQALAAMLNMRYLDALEGPLSEEQDRRPLTELVRESAVVQSLKTRGYSFVLVGTGFDMTDSHPLADTCINCGPTFPGLFETALLSVTPFRALAPWGAFFQAHHDRIAGSVDYLLHIPPAGAKPRYVFAHLLLPHPPFLQGPDGRLPDPPGAFDTRDEALFLGSEDDYVKGYAAQASYTLDVVRLIVTHLTQSAGPRGVVVIVNGDHGSGLHFDRSRLTEVGVGGRMAIFLATSWPRGRVHSMPRSPVNIYRVVFNGVFGTALPSLTDRSLVDIPDRTYRFREFTGDPILEQNGSTAASP
jgi:hypothetical protein